MTDTTVETVLGPVPAHDLGTVDAHEHVFLRTPVNPGEEFLDPDKAAAELSAVSASGIRTVVDLTPVGLGRRPLELADAARRSGVHVVAATGYHRAAHYREDHWARDADEETLLSILLDDLTVGIDRHDWTFPHPEPTTHRAGIIKLGASYQHIKGVERRWFAAGAEAARATGVPIAVHTEVGTAAFTALDLLAEHGIPAGRVLLAHTDRNPDPELHLDLIARGAHLVYDTIGRIKYRPDAVVLDLLETIAAHDGLDHVCLGTDVGRRSMLTSYGGGPGMDVLGRDFVPRLRRRLGDEAVRTVLETTPQRLLTPTPSTAAAPVAVA
ncbi:phosphotriesterase family protein [Embleya hyalina]|uniref:Phosphotriesterase n=1 Tax=Embleya hyalina TaxID=516124 RepID=A0A401Z5X9_9ACTN|nr:aryldialkylphosphatase [Embleya hyalina]GCE02226.1 phosphotriesterase [Embleya hyalina]